MGSLKNFIKDIKLDVGVRKFKYKLDFYDLYLLPAIVVHKEYFYDDVEWSFQINWIHYGIVVTWWTGR